MHGTQQYNSRNAAVNVIHISTPGYPLMHSSLSLPLSLALIHPIFFSHIHVHVHTCSLSPAAIYGLVPASLSAFLLTSPTFSFASFSTSSVSSLTWSLVKPCGSMKLSSGTLQGNTTVLQMFSHVEYANNYYYDNYIMCIHVHVGTCLLTPPPPLSLPPFPSSLPLPLPVRIVNGVLGV